MNGPIAPPGYVFGKNIGSNVGGVQIHLVPDGNRLEGHERRRSRLFGTVFRHRDGQVDAFDWVRLAVPVMDFRAPRPLG